MSAHTLTHMDAMRHFIADGATMEKMPLEAGIGPARVIEVEESAIARAIVEPHSPRPGERLLFKTSNSSRRWNDDEFHTDYVAIENDAARFLAERGVMTVGVDYLSVAPWHDLISTHVTLLGAGVWVIEGLDLSSVEPGDYDLICLPLKIEGSDGAPCRAVLRRR
jgi:arylformamidase